MAALAQQVQSPNLTAGQHYDEMSVTFVVAHHRKDDEHLNYRSLPNRELDFPVVTIFGRCETAGRLPGCLAELAAADGHLQAEMEAA